MSQIALNANELLLPVPRSARVQSVHGQSGVRRGFWKFGSAAYSMPAKCLAVPSPQKLPPDAALIKRERAWGDVYFKLEQREKNIY